ncbi:MAG: hypothetical protein G8345_21150, partial [Magnetococcales bacterium]|nr:hypothetical protein [Magnetococcales bacterium]NGZ29380.1 hypothetical protein [Magnetococcales bacterium]
TPQQPLALDPAPLDSLFLHIHEARECAKHRHTVKGEKIHCGFDGVQLCFAFGQRQAGDPPSLIPIPLDGVDQFFYQTPLRLPSQVIFDAADPLQCQRARQLATMIHTVQQHRQEIGIRHITSYQQKPLLASGPLRVLLPSSRADLDSRFFAEGMAHAFQSLGCEVRTLFEDLTRERYDTLNWLDLFQEFHPHVVFSISQHLNYWFHPQTVNVIWWQDPVGQLCRGEEFAWRPRDINFSFSRELDGYLRQARAPEGGLLRQGFCADELIFKPASPPLPRENKVVFVGSSYVNKGILAQTIHTPAGQKVYRTLLERMEAGQPFPRTLAGQLAAESGLSEHAVFWYYLHYVIRDQCVRWLCQASDLLAVEVYGGGKWAEDPVVAPFYKGYLPRGEAVARLYQQAKFTLVSHPFDLHSERLMEVAACGSIPIVYDCRTWSEPPHWDDHCLWFRTPHELRNCLQSTQCPDPTPIAQQATYQTFARRVLQEIEKRGFWPLANMGITFL